MIPAFTRWPSGLVSTLFSVALLRRLPSRHIVHEYASYSARLRCTMLAVPYSLCGCHCQADFHPCAWPRLEFCPCAVSRMARLPSLPLLCPENRAGRLVDKRGYNDTRIRRLERPSPPLNRAVLDGAPPWSPLSFATGQDRWSTAGVASSASFNTPLPDTGLGVGSASSKPQNELRLWPGCDRPTSRPDPSVCQQPPWHLAIKSLLSVRCAPSPQLRGRRTDDNYFATVRSAFVCQCHIAAATEVVSRLYPQLTPYMYHPASQPDCLRQVRMALPLVQRQLPSVSMCLVQNVHRRHCGPTAFSCDTVGPAHRPWWHLP